MPEVVIFSVVSCFFVAMRTPAFCFFVRVIIQQPQPFVNGKFAAKAGKSANKNQKTLCKTIKNKDSGCLINYGLAHSYLVDPQSPLSPLKGEISRSDRGVKGVRRDFVRAFSRFGWTPLSAGGRHLPFQGRQVFEREIYIAKTPTNHNLFILTRPLFLILLYSIIASNVKLL